LPEGTFIAWSKFTNSLTGPSYTITDRIDSTKSYPIWSFHVTNNIPFPTEQGTNTYAGRIILPYLAFNYLGQLTFDGQTLADRDEYIPLAHGSMIAAADPTTKAFVLASPPLKSPDVAELPPGNSSDGMSYSIVHIDRLTGRANLEFHKMQ
jgi:hypothetical protein